MAAIVSGNSLGLDLVSLKTPGKFSDVQARQTNGGAQSYVNVYNGNLVLQERDGLLAGPGMPQQIIRTYNSQGQFNDDNGDNWTTGVYRQQITLNGSLNEVGSSLNRLERDGGQSLYRWDAAQNCYLSTEGAGSYHCIRTDGADYLWSNGDNTLQERYARSNGRLLSTTDVKGNRLDYRFDDMGNLTRVTNSNGEATCYDYSGNNLTQIRLLTGGDQTLTCTRYTYDAQNRLTAVTVDLSPEDNSISDQHIYLTRYTYDGDSKRIASMMPPDGSQIQFRYVDVEQIWRVASITDGLGQITRYTYTANATTVSDALGQNTIYGYDSDGQLASVTTTPTPGVSAVTHYAYNQRGDVLRIIDADGRSIEMAYDDSGNQIRQQDSAGNLIERRYNARNQLITETIANIGNSAPAQTSRTIYDDDERNLLRFTLTAQGRVTEHRYDAHGQRVSSLQYSAADYDVAGLSATQAPTEAVMAAWVLQQDASATRRTDMQYDGRSQLAKITTYAALDSAGNGIADNASSVQYVYDQSGQLLKTIAASGAVTTWTYDGLGRVIALDQDGQLTLTRHDDSGNQIISAAADGVTTTRIYDVVGRLLSVTQSSLDTTLGTTRYTYDAGNRLIMSEDPAGRRQRILYDDAGRKVAEIDASGALTEYSYNRSGQLTCTRAYVIAVDAALLMHDGVIVFPDLSTIRPPANAADHVSWRTYDGASRLSKEINAHGAVTVMQYDASGQLLGTRHHATLIDTRRLGTTPADTDIQPASTDQDRHTRRLYEDGLLRATLDAEGYLSEIQYDHSAQEVAQIHYAQATPASLRASGTLSQLRPSANDGNDRVERKIRNNRGQLIGIIDAEGYLTEMRHDAGGNVTHRVRYANPATAVNPATQDQSLVSLRPASTAQDSVYTSVYDRHHRLLEETDAQGTITRYRHDKNGRLLATIKAADTSEQRQLLAQYDLFGRLTGELNAIGAALLDDNLHAADIDALWQRHGIRHTYDAVGRRLSSTLPEGRQMFYVYDANGRLTHTINQLGEVAETCYDALGQVSVQIQYAQRLNEVAALTAGPAARLQAALDTLQQDPDNSTVRSRYDNLGLLSERTDAIGAATQQSYNSFGELIRQTRSDGSQRSSDSHQYDRRGLLLETVRDVGNINLTTRLQYDAFGRPVHSTDAGGNITRMEYDRLGRQIITTDAIGGKIMTTYDAFDRIISQNDNGARSSYRYDAAARSSTLTTPDQVTVSTVYNRHGQQQSITDGNGNITRFSYDAVGNLTSHTGGTGTSTQAWDAANRLIETSDADGRQVRLQYDAANRLLTRTVDPDGLRLVTSYAYDARGRQLSITQADGQRTQFAYDAKGRLLAQTVDPDGLALTTRYTYDADGNTLSITDANGQLTRYVYDSAGRRIEEQIDPAGLALTRRYQYDANGNLTQAIDANGNATHYVFDQLNRQVGTIDPNRAQKIQNYDGSSQRVTRQTRRLHTQDEITQSKTGAEFYRMQTELHRYDAMGRPRWHINAGGAVQQLDYDANGNVVRRTSYATPLDEQQLLLVTFFASRQPPVTVDAEHDLVQRNVYDDGNRIRFEIDSLGAVIEHRYDASGILRERIAYRTPLSAELADQEHLTASLQTHVENHHGDIGNQRNTYLHDRAGRRQYEINAEGGVTSYRYDGHGNLQQTIGHATLLDSTALTALRDGNYDSAAIAAALQASNHDRVSTTLYDAAHRAQYQIDALGYLTEQQHDGNGNLIRSTRYAAPVTLIEDDAGKLQLRDSVRSGAQDVTEHRHYDAANRLRYRIDALGHVTEQRYDGLGQITHILNYQQALAADVARADVLAVERALRGEPATAADAAPDIPAPSASSTTQPAIDTSAALIAAAVQPPSEDRMIVDPAIDNETAPHLRISSGGDSMAVHAIYGNFVAGQTIRLSIQTKSEQHTVPVVRLFGSDAMHEASVSSSHSTADWQTLTVELTLQKADVLYVSLSAQRDPTVAGDAFVLYQDMRIASDEITFPNQNQSFESIKFSAAQSQDLDPETLQARGNLLSLPAEQRVWSGGWSTCGRVEHRVAASANASVAATDNETNPLQAHSLKLGAGDNDTVVRALGQFSAGDTVTLTVRSRSDLDTMTSAGLIGLHGEQSWEQLPQVYGTAGSWQTITVTARLTQDCTLLAYLSGYCPSSSPTRDNSVLFQDLRVSSTAQGIVLQDDFSNISFGDQALLQWNSTQVVDAALWHQRGDAVQHTHSAMELAATRQTDAVIANEMSPHLRICSTGDSLAVKRLNRNQLTAGDVQTLTLQVKSDQYTAADIRLFGTHAEHEVKIESIYGDGEWKTVTLTLTLTRPDAIFVSLGSRRNPLAGGNGFVLYRDLKLKHNDSVTDTDSFKYIGFAAAETQGLDPDTLQAGDHLQHALAQEDLVRQKRGWVTRGIAEHRSDDGGTSHVAIADVAQPIVIAADAMKIGSDEAFTIRRLGHFQQGDTLTVSLRAKSDSQTVAIPILVGTNQAGFKESGPGVYGNDRWNTITFSVTLQQDDEVFIALIGYGSGAGYRATNKVYFSDLKISSARQGALLENSLTAPSFGDFADLGCDANQWQFSNQNIDSAMWYTAGAVEACNTAEIANESNPETLALQTDATTMQDLSPANIASASSIPVEPVPQPGHIPASLLRYKYDRNGNLIQSTDALGHTEHYRYDGLNQRISFTNALGATTGYTYDAVGNLLSSTDALGNSESATYDSLRRRISSRDRLGAVTRYDYDQLGRVLLTTDVLGHTEAASYDALGNRSSVTNKLGGTSRYDYDNLGRQVSETLAVSATDADGQAHAIVNRQQYDAFGNRIATIEAAGLAEQRTTRYTFDALGRPLQQIGEATRSYVAGQGWKTVNPTETSRYDSRGNLIQKGDANGNLSRSYYDANHRVIAELSASGSFTTKDYDASGNVILQRMYGDVLTLPADDAVPTPINPDNYREIRYVYDAGNRLISSIQAQVGVAEQDSSSGNFTYAITDLITRTNYNAAGQVTMQQDAAGQRSYCYYNLLGHKVLAIDVGACVTTWDVDANGKVLREHAYAYCLDGSNPWTESSDPALLRQQLRTDAADVISEYEYDLQGRLIRSSRLNVHNASIGDDGALHHVAEAGTAHTRMVYNANGDLLQKVDANDNVSAWEYDLHARVNAKFLPVAIDYQGNAMRHTVRYHYNGLHALTRETETGSADGTDSSERNDMARHTRHHYDQAGRRSSQILASGDVIRYGYDANGNTSAEITERRQADGTLLREMTSMAYDGARREIRRISGNVDTDGNPHNNNDSMLRTHYDAYGNLVGKTTAAGDSNDNAQEFIDYDAAGRIWRSNTEGGITKVWCYDRNGKPTLTLQSQTLDLRSMTLAQIQAELAQPDSQIAATISIYDARGNLRRTIEPPMNSSRSHASLMALQGGGRFEGVQLTSGSTLTREVATGYLQGAEAVVDSVGVSGSLEFRASTRTWIPHRNEWLGSYGRKANRWFTVYFGNMKTEFQLSIPNMSSIYGAHKIMAVFNVNGTRPGGSLYWQNRIAFEERRDNLSFSHIFESSGTLSISRMLGSQGKNYTIDLYVIPQNGQQTRIGTLAGSAIWGQTIQGSSLLASGSNFLRLNNQTLEAATKVDLYYRAAGSTGTYTKLATSKIAGQSATYVANVAGMHANYDMLMVAVDQHGKLLRTDQLAVSRSSNTVNRNSGVANFPIFTAAGMHVAGLQLSNGKLATSLSYQRDQGEIVHLAARDGIPGLFDIPVTHATNLRMVLRDADDGSEHLVGSVDPASGQSNLQYLRYAESSLSFRNLDQQAVTLDIRYRLEGSDNWRNKQLQRQPGQGSDWTWDTQADGLVPDIEQSYRYEVQFDAFDAEGVKCNNGSAVIAAGAIDGGTYTTASITGAARPRWISFNPGLPEAQTLNLSYRASSSQDQETTVHLQRLPSGIFKFDSSALPPDQEYDYRTTALDAAGNPVHTMQGCFRSESRRQVSDGSNVQWIMAIDPDLHSTTQISRRQGTDAFGNITFETDGNGNTTNFSYNKLGQVVFKHHAAADITQENGYVVQGHRAEAHYYYNLGGQLVGAYDADGNLTTQRWHHGSGKVAQEWHADGGTKKNAYDVFGNLRHTINEDN